MSSVELSLFAFALLASGLGMGLAAGLFGIGGGVILVPVLSLLFRLDGASPDTAIHMAIGTSLAAIIPTSIASFIAHARHGAVDKELLRLWAPTIVVGSALGSLVAHVVGGQFLSLLFGAFALTVAFQMARPPKKEETTTVRLPSGPWQRLLAGAIGFLSSLLGIGGGSLSVPTMVMFGMPLRNAIGTSPIIGLLISLPATIIFMLAPAPTGHLPPGSFGHINLLAFTLLAPSSMLMAPHGADLAHKWPPRTLQKVFAAILLLIAAKMIVPLFL